MSDGLRDGLERLVRMAEWRTESSLSRDFTGRPFESPVPLADLRALLAQHPATPTEPAPCWCGHDWERHGPETSGCAECRCRGWRREESAEAAEVAVEEREALAELLMSLTNGEHGFGYHDYDSTSDRREGCGIVADALMPHIAALTAKAKAEGRVEALREAAVATLGMTYPPSPYPDVWGAWLYERADREAT